MTQDQQTPAETGSRPDKILVVDDDRIIIEVLGQSLSLAGYEVITAADGEEGLDYARRLDPDLILLDVMMPKLDGYSVCSQLKQDAATRLIPIIILTALTEKDDKLKALEVGADEFIRKPPDRQELLIRIKSLLRTKKLYEQVQLSYQGLRDLQQSQLDLTHMLVHDIRGPLGSIIGSVESLLEDSDSMPPERQEILLKSSLLAGRQIMTMTEAMLDVQRLESGKMPVELEPVSFRHVISQSVHTIRPLMRDGRVRLKVKADEPASMVMLDRELSLRVVNNLLLNAIRFSPDGGQVGIWTRVTPEWIVVSVADQGPGIPKEHREHVFVKYAQVHHGDHRRGVGLGLAFCKMAVEAMRGRIWVGDRPGNGALFHFALPLIPAPPPGQTTVE